MHHSALAVGLPLLSVLLAGPLFGFTPPVRTSPTLLIDDFEHWTSDAELQAWYGPKQPYAASLSTQYHGSGSHSMRIAFQNVAWSGFTHYGDSSWDISRYDSLRFWLRTDPSFGSCNLTILFRERSVCCAEVFAVTISPPPSVAATPRVISIARSRFAYVLGDSTNGVLDGQVEEFNIMLTAPCNTLDSHVVWIDDIEWVPPSPTSAVGSRPDAGARAVLSDAAGACSGMLYDLQGRSTAATARRPAGQRS